MADTVLRVPLRYYRDEENLESEEAMLRCTPLAIVASARVAQPNDYVVRTVLGASLLVTRDRYGTARVMLNYCSHRGARPAQGCGNASVFTCGYHGWVYDAAGQLVAIPGAQGFDGLDRSEHGLVELPVEERHGFIWACLTTGAKIDVAAHLGPMDDELARWQYRDYGYLTERVFESDVNWKGALEAFAESYHFPYVHGESLIGMNTVANTSIFDSFDRHHRLGIPFKNVARLRDDPSGSWDPKRQHGDHLLGLPESDPREQPVRSWRSSTSCRLAPPLAVLCATVGWRASLPPQTKTAAAIRRSTSRSTQRCETRTSQCFLRAVTVFATVDARPWSSDATR